MINFLTMYGTSLYRHIPIRREDWCWLVMMAIHPVSGEKFYFFDKALPFGSSRFEINEFRILTKWV